MGQIPRTRKKKTVETKLNEKQQKFADLIYNGEGKSKAYLQSGFPKKSPNSIPTLANRLYNSVKVQKYLESLRNKTAKKNDKRIDKVIDNLYEIAMGNHLEEVMEIKNGRVVIKDKGRLKNIDGISYSEHITDKGQSKSFSIKKTERVKAMELLLKATGKLNGTQSNSGQGDEGADMETILSTVTRIKRKQ